MSEVLKNMNWPTVVLIALTGGTNWIATQNNSSSNRYEIDRARDQINQIFNKIDDFESSSTRQIENQNQILKNQTEILKRLEEVKKTGP